MFLDPKFFAVPLAAVLVIGALARVEMQTGHGVTVAQNDAVKLTKTVRLQPAAGN
jgi:hypothetical protein